MTRPAPKGFRLHIGIFGRRNAGKSSLLNAITRQQVSIVSDVAGTTTDPVEKPMELQPLGPCCSSTRRAWTRKAPSANCAWRKPAR
jgi:ribosome-binding ATPase YchF (GTP1/OBG family)